MGFKFIHAADIHLDSPLRGLERYAGAPIDEVQNATRRSLENLVQLAIDEGVAFVLLAGDVFDGKSKDYHTGVFFSNQMLRLNEAGIRVYGVFGNHDAECDYSRSVELPSNVITFGRLRPETHQVPGLGVAIHGQSYRARDVYENLVVNYPTRVPDVLNIGLLHTAMQGAEGHARYAPCSLDDLRALHYDYWALGHVHGHSVVSESPWVVYAGCTQGRHSIETGARGCCVVKVEDGRVAEMTTVPLCVLQWARVPVVATLDDDADRLTELIIGAVSEAAGRVGDQILGSRIMVSGTGPGLDAFAAHTAQWAERVRDGVRGAIANAWVEKVKLSVAEHSGAPTFDDDDVAMLLDEVRSQKMLCLTDPTLSAEMTSLKAALPPEAAEGEDAVDPRCEAYLAACTEGVEAILVDALGLLGGDE